MRVRLMRRFRNLPSFAPGRLRSAAEALAFLALAVIGSATDLTIHLPKAATLSHKIVHYQCDPNGAKIGVPAGSFAVEYINGGGNSLVVVPVSGNALIFSNVMAGSGARYTAQQYKWWEAGGAVTLTSDALAGKIETSCKVVKGA